MLAYNVSCTKCFSITNYSAIKSNANQFVLGTRAWKTNSCYLFFPIDQLSSAAKIIHAELILYRKRKNEIELRETNKYVIFATKTYLNPQYMYTDGSIKSVGDKFYYQVYSDEETLCLDVTALVSAWNEGKIRNRGLLLRHLDEGSLIGFMGTEFMETAPFIRIYYSLTGEKLPAYVESSVILPSSVSIVKGDAGE